MSAASRDAFHAYGLLGIMQTATKNHAMKCRLEMTPARPFPLWIATAEHCGSKYQRSGIQAVYALLDTYLAALESKYERSLVQDNFSCQV
jgi:hypothetical protein